MGEEVRALEEEKAAAAAAAEAVAEAAAKAAAAASVSTNGHKETTGENGVSTQQARKEDGGVVLIATFGDRSPVKGSLAEALEDADASSVEGVHGEVGQNEEPGLWQATEAEEAEAAHAHSEYIRFVYMSLWLILIGVEHAAYRDGESSFSHYSRAGLLGGSASRLHLPYF